MSDWDRKFARMVAETERHLASVKSQLDSPPVMRRSNDTIRRLNANSNLSTPSYLRKSSPSTASTTPTTSPSSILRKSGSGIILSSESKIASSPPKRNVSFDLTFPPTSSSSSAGLALLGEKLRAQHKDIATLRESVSGLQQCMQQQHSQIVALKEEMHLLQMKMVDCGSNYKMENQLKQFKQEIFLEVETLKNKVLNLSGAASRVNAKPHFDTESFATKLRRSEAMASLQRDISSMNSKLVSQESKITVVNMGMKEMKRNHDKMLSEMKEKCTKFDDFRDHSLQLRSLRDLLSSLERRIDAVERLAFKPNSTSTPSHSRDISPVGVKPARRNPLYKSSRSFDSYLKQEGIGESVSASLSAGSGNGYQKKAEELEDGEGSDLDGHTLSCSLELMSDLEGSDLDSGDLVSMSDGSVSLSTLA